MFGLNSQGQQQLNAGIACGILSGTAVAIRIYCKVRHKQGVRSDDWWICATLAWYWASIAIVGWGSVTGGGGKEMKELLALAAKDKTILKQMSNFLESMFLAFTFSTTAIYCCKMSVLLFYRHIFFVTESYRKASLSMMILSTAWFIATQVANLLICQPIDSFWNRSKPGKCLNFNIMFLGTGIVDTLIDLAILLLPIRMAFTLRLPKKTQIAVAGIFALGGFVIITSIIRLRYIYQPKQKYVSFAEGERWTNIHMITAITCACLPIYKPLWSSISTATGNLLNRYASSLRSILGYGSNHSAHDPYVRMGAIGNSASESIPSKERDLERGFVQTSLGKQERSTITVTGGNESDQEPLNVPKGGIAYSREVHVV